MSPPTLFDSPKMSGLPFLLRAMRHEIRPLNNSVEPRFI
jgi:hypothetical protein